MICKLNMEVLNEALVIPEETIKEVHRIVLGGCIKNYAVTKKRSCGSCKSLSSAYDLMLQSF